MLQLVGARVPLAHGSAPEAALERLKSPPTADLDAQLLLDVGGEFTGLV